MRRLALIVSTCLFLASCLQGNLTTNTDPPDATNVNGETGPNAEPNNSPADTLEPATCGDGRITGAERCDGDCPTVCDDGNTCTSDVLSGSPTSCDVQCAVEPISDCINADGCCADGCDATTDDDCSASCGDGVVDEAETCDGNCPTACDDGNACTVGTLTGTPDACNVQCSTVEITACTNDDGCCPTGCEASTDSDCAAVCGNGVVEGLEVCDGDCPLDCDDNVACTADRLAGSAATCDAVCTNTPIGVCVGGDGCCPAACSEINDSDCLPVCGNDVVETGETCDGACSDCNDGVACTQDAMTGSAATCNVQCTNSPITACVDGDGCCAPGCDTTNDSDCDAVCGNGIIEGGETCDPVADCPTTCNDMDACTTDTLVGGAATCDAVCLYQAITACTDGDGCCPSGCDANMDDDCVAICGNAVVEPGEACDPMTSCPASVADCDDGNACTGDQFSGDPSDCSAACIHNDVTACIDGDGCCPSACDLTNDSDCVAMCGNGIVEAGETCDPVADCPTDCDDQDSCTVDTLTGSPASCTAECQNVAITMCIDDDNCCPTGCDETTDNDCLASCDNDVIETGETCDPIASCPTACDDMDDCTDDVLQGSASNCTAECVYTDITMCIDGDGCCPTGCNANDDDDCAAVCGNDVVEPGETCDPVADCPTDCDDSDDCTIDTLSGDASICTSQCTYTMVAMCIDADGCCPMGCTYADDDDCPIVIDCTDPATWPSGWTSLEDQIFAETNARRTTPAGQVCNGVLLPAQAAFVMDSRLREAARCHAIDMASNNFFSHTGTGGTSPGSRATDVQYDWNAIGENIAAGNSVASAIVDQWMNSTTGHCEAIMDGTYEDLGVGYAFDADATYEHYSVLLFGREF